jgi:branched-subunit amino acid aminotransferase/4-amino-4-deoxychorismate lyase
MNKIILNGNIESAKSVKFGPENRAFRYGDGLFETMHIQDGEVRFYDQHYERLTSGMHALSMKIPDYFPNMKDYILHFLKEQN